MSLLVKKFGGTSVGDLDKIRNVADIIRSHLVANPEEKVVAVASAMAGETNRLIELARKTVPQPDPRELDTLLATGEQVTVSLLAMVLQNMGIPARSFLAQQAKISTDSSFNRARITDIETSGIEASLKRGEVPVVAGFQGVDEEGSITTLGRGGSDITAVAIAAALKAKACYIYTDVDGVYAADPRVCPKTRMLDQISHEEMLELASLGAKVLHPRSVYFAMCYDVPLIVLSTFTRGKGTWIVREGELMEKPVVSGVTYRTDETKITINNLTSGIKSLDRIFGLLGAEGIYIDMITQTGPIAGLTNVSFTVLDEYGPKALEIVQYCVKELGASDVRIESDIAKVSVVGVGMRYHAGVATMMFQALAAENIDVEMISTSEIKISVIVPRKYCEVAVRTLHDAFISEQPEVSIER